jgi:uncharacterized membrane protein
MIGSHRIRYRQAVEDAKAGQNPVDATTEHYSALDRFAVALTGKIGTMKFALIIIGWTVIWVGYNLLASIFGWPKWDSFPALVAYLLISNVIQICLMPLIMVSQNLQSRLQEAKAEQDYKNNARAVEILEQLLADRQVAQKFRNASLDAMGYLVEKA